MKPGLTREELQRAFPGAPPAFIEKNIGNTDWTFVRPQMNLGDAFERIQRKDPPMIAVSQKQDPKSFAPTNGAEVNLPANARAGQWFEIGGQRFFSRSKWERNYACYLEALKVRSKIRDWQYEPRTYWFEGIKRGTNSYKPDFLVIFNDGSVELREVKGWLDPKSKTKLKRMKKYHPGIKVRLIGADWFKQHGPVLSQCVPGWSKKKPVAMP